MGFSKVARSRAFSVTLLLLLATLEIQSATVKDIFNLNPAELTRTPRETQYYGNRYGSSSSSGQTVASRPIKPEDAPEARERDSTNVEKRCVRCDYYNKESNNRNPYESSRGRYDERYDDRGYRDRYEDKYKDRYYDDYERRYYDSDRRYYDTDRRYNYDNERRYDDRDRYDRYDNRERYDRRPESYDRYDRDRYDRDDRNRYYDRYDRNGYRPWDETTRGSSGFDSNGKGYYFAVGRPEYSNYGSGYASNWNYGGGRDTYNNRDRGWREQGTTSSKPISFSSSSYRPRDPYDSGYRGTSYLYGRPSSTTTTQSPSSSGSNTVTANPQTQDNTSSG